MNYREIRQLLYDTVLKAVEVDLIRLSAGNISTRTVDGHVAITPSGIQYSQLKPEQISIIDIQGELLDGPKPSSETAMHTAILRAMPEVEAVCHTHSPYAMTFAVLGKEIPIINTETLVCGAPIPVAEWASPGSAAGGVVAVKAFQQHPGLKALLLRNHGGLTIGENLAQAFDQAYNLEFGARVYYQALSIGTPNTLTAEQVQQIREIYGLP